MGSRLKLALPLLVLAAALTGCGGDRVPAADSLEAKLKDANTRANDGTSVNRQHSLRKADERANRV